MNKKLLEILMGIKVVDLVKKGWTYEEAVDKAASELKDEALKAEFNTHCSEHDC